MASGTIPAYRDFLTCLLPDPTGTATLCQLLEDTLFGAHVDEDQDVSSDNASGFADNADSEEEEPDPFNGSQVSTFNPSRFIWRNSVTIPVRVLDTF